MRFSVFIAGLVLALCAQPTTAQDFRALWVDCEGQNRTLWSKPKIVEMLETARPIGRLGIGTQVSPSSSEYWVDSRRASPYACHAGFQEANCRVRT